MPADLTFRPRHNIYRATDDRATKTKPNRLFDHPALPEPRSPKAVRTASKPSIEITGEFQIAVESVVRRQWNLFITGKAGTGKSTLLHHIRAALNGRVALLAPTGRAALNIGGQTIHSFFRFAPRLLRVDDIRPSRRAALFRQLDVLFIDEISMVRADVLDAVDRSLRVNRGRPNEPFGGVRVVLIGDQHQLPPVVASEAERRYLEDHYGGVYFFNAPVFKQEPFRYLELTKTFRQTDPEFVAILNDVAEGRATSHSLGQLNHRVTERVSECDAAVILAPHNDTVFQINIDRLASLPGKELVSHADIAGDFDESAYPTDATLQLKVGAKVVLLRNDPQRRWVNGTLGQVSRLDGAGRVSVNIGHANYEVERIAWEKIRYEYDSETRTLRENVVGSFKQLPLRLAWALTIHKSQGMTLDNVHVNLDRGAFAHGQTYVALSRCRSLSGLSLARKLSPSDLIFDPEAVRYREKLVHV